MGRTTSKNRFMEAGKNLVKAEKPKEEEKVQEEIKEVKQVREEKSAEKPKAKKAKSQQEEEVISAISQLFASKGGGKKTARLTVYLTPAQKEAFDKKCLLLNRKGSDVISELIDFFIEA